MSFGNRTHQTSAEIDANLKAERDRLVTTLRGLADQIEHAPLARLPDGLVSMSFAVEPLVRAVERALGD